MNPSDEEVERARRLTTEPAQRILAAARRLVAERGVERSHVVDIAREAGVARGLVTYYFATKDRLLAEVMEADAQMRLDRLALLVANTATRDQLLQGLGAMFDEFRAEEPGSQLALWELAVLALRNSEIGERRARVCAAYRQRLAAILAEKQRAGIIVLTAEPEDIAAVLIALNEGLVAQVIAERGWDSSGATVVIARLSRCLLAP